jgi:hypothetical protein
MNDVEQIIRINGYIQRKLGTLTYGGKEVYCVALDHSCTFENGEEITLDDNQLAEVFRQTFYIEERHTITILKLDREEEVAKRLAEEELAAICGPYTDRATITHHALRERYAAEGMIGYMIRLEASLTEEELTTIRQKQRERERIMIANIGKAMINNEDIGVAWEKFYR